MDVVMGVMSCVAYVALTISFASLALTFLGFFRKQRPNSSTAVGILAAVVAFVPAFAAGLSQDAWVESRSIESAIGYGLFPWKALFQRSVC